VNFAKFYNISVLHVVGLESPTDSWAAELLSFMRLSWKDQFDQELRDNRKEKVNWKMTADNVWIYIVQFLFDKLRVVVTLVTIPIRVGLE